MQQLSRRSFLQASGIAGAGLLLAGCGADAGTPNAAAPSAEVSGDELVTKAKAEGGLRLYTLDQGMADAMIAGFKKQYDWARVETVVGTQSDLRNRTITESISRAQTADVVTLTAASRQPLLDKKAIRPVQIQNESALPKGVIDPSNLGHPFYQLIIVYSYNSNLTSTPPSTFEGLSDPQWKGKIAFDNPQNGGTSTTFLVSRHQQWGDAKWQSWLADVGKNGILITQNSSSALDQVQRGERALSLNTSQEALALPSGTPVKVGFYQDLAPIVQYAYLTTGGKNPYTGQLFVEWLVSQPGQEAIASTGRAPVLDIDTPVSLSKIIPSGTNIMSTSELADFYKDPAPDLAQLAKVWPA